ncbi:MAG: hypothetical protein Fur0017_13080 [Anaerolineales bacterium]
MSNNKTSKALAISITVIQIFDIFIHAATNQLEPLRVTSNLVLLAWLVIWMFGKSKDIFRTTSIGAISVYLLLNIIFLAREGFTNPEQGGEPRAKMQGFFSGVWGVSSIAGPLLGSFIVDKLSWHWVFYINVVPGLLAAALVALAWRDQPRGQERPAVDYLGAILLTVSIVTLLIGLTNTGFASNWILITTAMILFILLVWVESRAVDPILPIRLFRLDRLFASSIAHRLERKEICI